MLKDKVIIVTGGAGLLGQDFARAIIEHNGVAAIADIDVSRGRQFRDSLPEQMRPSAEVIHVDITSKDSIVAMTGFLHGKYGRIDALVNSAYPKNRNYGRHVFDVEYRDFCENLDLHLGGYFLMMQQMALYFRKQGHGNIVNLASVYGMMAPRFDVYEGTNMTMPVEYAAIKAALIHLTKYMARALKGSGIRVNAISPGGILDGQPESFLERYASHCMSKGMLDKADIRGTLLYLLSDMSHLVTGQNIIVDDGYSL